mgnify:CR=1 FL=1
MKNAVKNIKTVENIIYIIVWLVVFLMPLFFSQNTTGTNWERVMHEWLRIIPFLVIFLIHNYVIFPGFFISRKYLFYFVSLLLLIFGISAFTILIGREVGPSRGIIPRPMEMPPPFQKTFPAEDVPALHTMRLRLWLMLLFEDFITSVLVIGFNSAIKLTIKWQHEEQKNKELEKEKLQTELAFLRNQVSPHFFMNTLNNIHALIDVNTENAKESIIKLSKLMRYMLYDSEQGKTTLKKEIGFIQNYVDLMRLRFSSKLKIDLSFPGSIPDVKIPPMLFTSLVENAFKHGVSYQSESFIGIYLRIQEKNLVLRIKNSLNKNNEAIEKGGLGLKNLRKRLELIYGSGFELNSSENDSVFEVNVKIPLNGN